MGLLTNLSLFSGAGGLDLGAKLVGGFRTVCYVENDRYAQGVIRSRIRDGGLDDAPIWDDVRTFDGKSWRGLVDVVSGGFPCQDLSLAGKRAGLREGTRSGLWYEYSRIIGEVRPRFVLVENVPGILAGDGLGIVLGSLAEMGYDATWRVISAASVGAPHLRERVWIMADADRKGLSQSTRPRFGVLPEPAGASEGGKSCGGTSKARADWSTEPDVGRVAHGVASRVDRLRLCGNGVVPQQAVPAWEAILKMANP